MNQKSKSLSANCSSRLFPTHCLTWLLAFVNIRPTLKGQGFATAEVIKREKPVRSEAIYQEELVRLFEQSRTGMKASSSPTRGPSASAPSSLQGTGPGGAQLPVGVACPVAGTGVDLLPSRRVGLDGVHRPSRWANKALNGKPWPVFKERFLFHLLSFKFCQFLLYLKCRERDSSICCFSRQLPTIASVMDKVKARGPEDLNPGLPQGGRDPRTSTASHCFPGR